jgi:hypothetical protein
MTQIQILGFLTEEPLSPSMKLVLCDITKYETALCFTVCLSKEVFSAISPFCAAFLKFSFLKETVRLECGIMRVALIL